MVEDLTALIVDESKWLTASMVVALVAVGVLVQRHGRRPGRSLRQVVLAAMSLAFGTTIAAMAFGHLLAVSVKLVTGTLAGSAAAFYAIGVALAVPSALLVRHACRLPGGTDADRTRTLVLTGWPTLTLLALGLHNLPLAVPGLLNIGYLVHSRPAVGWVLAGLAVLVHLALFVGSLVFLASGQSFEQFRGIE